jgi:hypothetical protein
MTDPTPMDDLAHRRARIALEWVKPANWSGTREDEWLGTVKPPWGDKVRCRAHNGDGRRCRKAAIPGGRVCQTHGGSAEQVKRKAALRLMNLVDPMITVLVREATTADRSSDRQRAANSLLDRAGVGRANADLVTTEVARTALIEQIKRARREAAAAEADVIEAELADETDIEDADIVDDEDAEFAADLDPDDPIQRALDAPRIGPEEL